MARPKKTLDDKQLKELELLSAFLDNESLASYFGMSNGAFYNMLNREERINGVYKQGKAKAKAIIASALMKKVQAGDTASIIFASKTRLGLQEVQRVDHTSSDGSMSPQANVTDEQIAAWLKQRLVPND